jgi:hypothetical protein
MTGKVLYGCYQRHQHSGSPPGSLRSSQEPRSSAAEGLRRVEVAASVPTGGASLLVTAGGGSAATAGWAAVGHGATGIVAGLATIADSLSLSTGAGSPP